MISQGMKKRIEAVQLLKHFVKLSRVLLPYYAELTKKNSLTLDEVRELGRLKEIYENYQAHPDTSRVLINSDILNLIHLTYQSIKENQGRGHEPRMFLREFMKESDRLQSLWDNHQMN